MTFTAAGMFNYTNTARSRSRYIADRKKVRTYLARNTGRMPLVYLSIISLYIVCRALKAHTLAYTTYTLSHQATTTTRGAKSAEAESHCGTHPMSLYVALSAATHEALVCMYTRAASQARLQGH